MKTISRTIDAFSNSVIDLGVVGDHLTTELKINVSAWDTEFPGAGYTILFLRQGETVPYPVLPTYADGVITYAVTATETEKVGGNGYVQVLLTLDGTVKRRTPVAVFRVMPNIGDAGAAPPAPGDTWLADMALIKDQTVAAKDAAVVAKEAAEQAFAAMATAEFQDLAQEYSAELIDINAQLATVVYNVKAFGAVGNANYFNASDKLWYTDAEYTTLAADDTAAIQAALDVTAVAVRNIIVPDGNYQVNPAIKLQLKSNTRIVFSQNAVLVAKTSNNSISSMLDVVHVDNIEIINPTIIGDRDHNTQVAEGAGHGISCRSVTNLIIRGGNMSDCFTDGIYVNNVTNGLIEFCTCDNNRRQGMSIISAKNLTVRNFRAINTNGTAPQMGIDIEANNANEILENVRLENIYTENNVGGGIGINYNGINDASTVVDVVIDQWKDVGSAKALSITKFSGVVSPLSTIRIQGLKSVNAVDCAISIMQIAEGSAKIILDRPEVYNPKRGGGTNQRTQDVAISIHDDTTGFPDGLTLGNVEIIEPYIDVVAPTVLLRGLYLGYGQTLKNVSIIDPRKINIGDMTILSANSNHNLISFGTTDDASIIVTDKYGVLHAPHSGTLIRNYGTAIYSKFTTSANSLTVTLNEYAKWGIVDEFKVVKTGTSQTLNINLPATITFYDGTSVVSGVLSSASNGAVVSFKRITTSAYRIIKEIGTWTIA